MDSSAAGSSRDINYRSFSSSLLDQIYRSIDEHEQGPSKSHFHQDHDHQPPRATAPTCLMQPAAAVVGRRSSAAERSCMRRYDQRTTEAVSFYGLNSSSSSCDSCGSVKLIKPPAIRTEEKENIKRPEKQRLIGRHEHDDDKEESKGKGKSVKTKSTKSKSKAALKKIYSDLKQPTSPGGRLASFLNSLFTTTTTNGNQKKRNTTDDLVGISPQILLDRKSKSANASTCSSRSSCLSNTTTTTTIIPSAECRVAGGKFMSNGMKRSVVRFYPLDDCQLMPYGHTLYSSSLHQQPPINTHTKEKLNDFNRQAALTKNFNSSRKSSTEHHVNHSDDQDDESDSSSDLFELDHLSVDKYRQELPVYKTTQLDRDELFV